MINILDTLLSESTLRILLMVLLTMLCYSVWKIFRSKINAYEKSKELRGNWVRNKHVRSVEEAEFFFKEALVNLSPSLNIRLDENKRPQSNHFPSYFNLLKLVSKHARMAFCASDDTRFRLNMIGKNKEVYEKAVRAAIKLQDNHINNFFELMDRELPGSKEFVLKSHKKFMKDFGKRILVISRLN